jgi:hypothetical protein
MSKTLNFFQYPLLLPILLMAAMVCSQEGIKFEIPTDNSGLPAAPPPKQEPQKLGVAVGLPLNLSALSAKDTAGFETYSKRHALIQDSIAATYRAIESVKKNTESFMPKLEPKSEFEKQAEYDARLSKWNTELTQRIEKDTKSLTQRLAELEKAKVKIQENQASLYGTLDIKSNPSGASIWLGREEIGATPAEYSLLIPGEVKISVRKEGYDQWDTSLTVAPGAKFKLSVQLEEKSIFSKENEINFSKLLSKDTTAQGYNARIDRAKACKAEIDGEIKQLLEDFKNSYPALEPQKVGEKLEDFEKRKNMWNSEGMRRYTELQRKHEVYSARLVRSVETLSDYIIATESAVIAEAAIFAKAELGAYDAEKETFEMVAQDSSSGKSPFYFIGKVGIPVATAKEINRAAPGFSIGLQFINYPFEADTSSVNLAMSKLLVSLNGKELNVQGSFGEIKSYSLMKGYYEWKLHADSLLSGMLKPQGLDYAYAMGKSAAKDVAKKEESGESGDGIGGLGWTRIITFTAAAGCAGVAVFKNSKVNKFYGELPDTKNISPTKYKDVRDDHNGKLKEMKKYEDQRLYYSIGAGALAAVGMVTFFF